MRYLTYLWICILCVSCVFSQNYADVQIDIDKSGIVSIKGSTNTPELLIASSSEFTSKKGKYWVFNYSVGYYDNFIYSISLPEGASINYLKIPELSRFEDTSEGLKIKGATQNRSVDLLIQYSITKDTGQFFSSSSILTAFFVLIMLGITFILFKKKSQQTVYLNNIKHTLTSRQKIIIELLQKNNGRMSQKELENKTHLVKSSLSRNIDSLVRRQIILKEKKGMSNIITFRTVPVNSGKK